MIKHIGARQPVSIFSFLLSFPFEGERLENLEQMHWTEPATADDSHAALEKKLWDAANMLWAGADLKPSDWSGATKTNRQGSPKGERGGAHQYSPTVLGLIFLRYADVRFAAVRHPDLPTQRKIAGILSAYDDLIENNLRRIKILEQMAQSLYREWFVHFRFPGHESAKFKDSELGGIPDGWEMKKLGNLADQMRRSVPKGQLDEVTRYVGLEHISRQSLALDAWEEVSELGSNKLLFKRGEVLFGKIRPYFHKVVVAPFDGVSSADTIIIRAKKPDHWALVTFCVFTEAFVAHATATSNGSKMPRTDWKVLKDYPLVLPPNDLLAHFSKLSEKTIDQQQNLVKRNQTLRRTRDLLLPKLLLIN